MEGGRRGELRRTMTLSEQLASPDPEIRNFLKIPQNADCDESHHAAPMDAAGDDPDAADADGGINWKPLKDRLLLRRAGSAWPAPSSSSSATADDADDGNAEPSAPAFSRSMSRAVSIRPGPGGAAFSRATSVRPRSAAATNTVEEEEDGAPVTQMSLMTLLEQTDSQWEEEGGGMEEEEEEAGEEEEGSEEMVHVCCVCMVRHKGAAFIPCGHTFCRLCSRELWVSRGNCPLCNGFIQEILDIF